MSPKLMTGITLLLGYLYGFAQAERAFVSLDSCDFVIPKGYFVNSGSIRDKGVTLISTESGEGFGTIGIRYGVSETTDSYEEEGFRIHIVREGQTRYYRYYVLSVSLPGVTEEQETIRIQTDRYTLSLAGDAVTSWEEHLVCPAFRRMVPGRK